MLISIRQAQFADVPNLEKLIALSVRGLSTGFYTPRQIESALVHLFGVDTQLIADGTYYVAEIDGQIVGGGGWSKRLTLFGGDQTKSGIVDRLLDPQTEAARIRAFFVHPDWARRGIGRKIIEACEAAAKQEKFSKLELAATLPGEPLYAAVGYTRIELINVSLPDGEILPIVRMAKNISLES
ncbi:MAG TPA: GNAT family N-acetyltransferase [Blastocatellia bacterium]|nr:GNAT family N-acetyltransferase [Blastocatellia bacterium]